MLDRLGIRGKVLAVVAVPILVLILAAGFIVAQSAQSLGQARDAERVLDVLTTIHDVQGDFQNERWAATNFVHAIQDGESKLDDSYDSTDAALVVIQEQLDVLSADPELTAEGPSVEEIQTQLDAAISRTASGTYLADPRAVTIGVPTEESGGWVVFPSEDAVASMQSGYESAASAVDALADSLPDEYDLDVPLAALAFRIGNESAFATTLFTEPQEYRSQLEQAANAVNSSVQQLGVDSSLLQVNAENEQAIAVLNEAEEALASLPQIRQSTMDASVNVAFLTNFYSAVIDATVRSSNVVGVTMGNADIVSNLQGYADLDLLVESMLFEEAVTQRLIRAGEYLPGEEAQVRTMTTRTDIALSSAQQANAGIDGAPEVPGYGASAGDVDGDADSFVSVRTQVLSGLNAALVGERESNWPAQVDAEVAVYTDIRTEMWDRVESAASSARSSALLQTILTAVAAIVIVGLSLVVALLIARRIVGPMRRLTTTATAVRTELPRLVERVAVPGEDVDVSEVQIPVESQDEVGRLADAFNAINATTLGIAAEQAALRGSISEMFVNVARRDQVLLNRQLASIDDMERTEDDPDTLTKLFALDHLATRMRRNSESLLVLAGIDTGRRLRRPMPLSDVIRTASSEIELYERVELDLHDDPAMLGHAALTTAHLFAELLENATVFSDPGSPVTVSTSRTDEGFIVTVSDDGIGMTESEVADANARVASTAASEILGAQRLGLFVVGRIARRVGATVSIESREGEGTVATVTLPSALFASDAPDAFAPQATSPASSAPAAPDHGRPAAAPAALAGAAYAPAAVEEGASLSGRGGDALPARGGDALPARGGLPARGEAPAGDGNSIDELIAADAAVAPEVEPTNPESLTDGSSAAGLPARRRRTTPTAADEEHERKSVVGLPARATDAQLSALAAEADSGFMPAVPAGEIAPQSAEERASMFRGFRSRRETEQEVGGAAPLPTRRRPEAEADADDAEATPEAPVVPGLAPDDDADNEGSAGVATAAGAAAAGAAAFSAAAFFGGRDRSAQSAPAGESDQSGDTADEQSSAADTLAHDDWAAPAAAAQAPEAAPEPEPEPEPEPIPTYELEPDADAGVAGFRMPKFDAATTGQFAAIRDDEPSDSDAATEATEAPATDEQSVPAWAAPSASDDVDSTPDDGDSAADIAAQSEPAAAEASPWAPAIIHDDAAAPQSADPADEAPAPASDEPAFTPGSPFVIPSLEDDEPAAEEAYADAEEANPQSAPPVNPFAPVFGAAAATSAPEQPAVADDEPAAFAPTPWSAQDEPQEQLQDHGGYGQPSPSSAPEPAAPEPWVGIDPSAPQAPAAAPQPWTRTPSPVSAASATPVAAASADSPQLDALIQSAVEDDHKPGFFSRLFGRGKSETPAPVQESPASAQSAQSAVPASAPSAATFEPAPEPAPQTQAQQATDAGEAGQLNAAPQRASFMPVASPQPEPEAEPVTTEPEPWAPPAYAAPSQASAPEAWAPPVPEPQPQSFQPAQSFEPEPQAPQAVQWPEQPPAENPTSFTPDDLARATGWEAAGQSALQAAEPDSAAGGYQPIIQPEPLAHDEPDVTSAVFSELSSLASERPKIEKTRAGLQKRRPSNAPQVEVKPLEAEVEVKPAERDADAVRERFSSFYSGTQRARSDVESMDNIPSNPGSQQ